MMMRNFFFKACSPSSRRATIAAFAAPPIAMALCAIVISVLMVFDDSVNGPATANNLLDTTGATFFFGSCIAYLGIAVIGLPTLLALKVFRAQRGISYILVGSISTPVLLLLNGDTLLIGTTMFFIAAVPGFLVSACWWLLATL